MNELPAAAVATAGVLLTLALLLVVTVGLDRFSKK